MYKNSNFLKENHLQVLTVVIQNNLILQGYKTIRNLFFFLAKKKNGPFSLEYAGASEHDNVLSDVNKKAFEVIGKFQFILNSIIIF